MTPSTIFQGNDGRSGMTTGMGGSPGAAEPSGQLAAIRGATDRAAAAEVEAGERLRVARRLLGGVGASDRQGPRRRQRAALQEVTPGRIGFHRK